jgi:hypothetical protein
MWYKYVDESGHIQHACAVSDWALTEFVRTQTGHKPNQIERMTSRVVLNLAMVCDDAMPVMELSDLFDELNGQLGMLASRHDGQNVPAILPLRIDVESDHCTAVLTIDAERVVEEIQIADPQKTTCHNPHCTRYGLTMVEMQATAYNPDLFHFDPDLDSLVCPDCGGTDVY